MMFEKRFPNSARGASQLPLLCDGAILIKTARTLTVDQDALLATVNPALARDWCYLGDNGIMGKELTVYRQSGLVKGDWVTGK